MRNRTYATADEGSRFVIVAPHAAGDDKKTGDIADKVAELVKGAVVINDKFVKPSNSNARADGKDVEDFNKLSWNGRRYVWDDKKPQMKKFYDTIEDYVVDAREHSSDGKATIVYIHGMRDGVDGVGIDIGYGVKHYRGKLKSAKSHPRSGDNTGVRRASYKDIKILKDRLRGRMYDRRPIFKIGIAQARRYHVCNGRTRRKDFAAWSSQNGIQFHRGSSDASFQLEICEELRKTPNYIAGVIAEALKKAYR